MSDADIVERLKSIDHMNVDECFLDSHLYAEAATEITALRQRVKELKAGLVPFAKADELFQEEQEYEMNIYSPAAGLEYAIGSNSLRKARALLEKGEKG